MTHRHHLLLQLLGLAVLSSTVLGSCSRRPTMASLAGKLDSIKHIENMEQLRNQGIDLNKSDNAVQLFYDSLAIQPLPLASSAEYLRYLPNYTDVPMLLVSYLNLEGRTTPRAIALPESVGVRLMLLAADKSEGEYTLWLYSLDIDYMPVDKLPLDSPFAITSDYSIRLLTYDDKLQIVSEDIYVIDPSRHFQKQ